MTGSDLKFQSLNIKSSPNNQHYSIGQVSVCKIVSGQPFLKTNIKTYKSEFIQNIYLSEPPRFQCDSCFFLTA